MRLFLFKLRYLLHWVGREAALRCVPILRIDTNRDLSAEDLHAQQGMVRAIYTEAAGNRGGVTAGSTDAIQIRVGHDVIRAGRQVIDLITAGACIGVGVEVLLRFGIESDYIHRWDAFAGIAQLTADGADREVAGEARRQGHIITIAIPVADVNAADGLTGYYAERDQAMVAAACSQPAGYGV